jgi:O-antigen ligase
MRKYLPAVAVSLTVSLSLLTVLYFVEYSHERFVIKGALFSSLLIAYIIAMFAMKTEHIVYTLIFVPFFDVQIRQLFTNSTNVLIIISLLVLWTRHVLSGSTESWFDKIRNSSVTLPLILLICSYTLSLLFARLEMGTQLMMYHSVICASALAWMIVSTVRDESRLRTVNNLMLAVLLANLLFSVIFQFMPAIDTVRAQFFGLYQFSEESATRIQGLSFRGEGYGEYLMVCAISLFVMLLGGQVRRGRLFLWLVTIASIVIMIMTRSRGANLVFFIGALFFLVTSRSLQVSKRVASLAAVALIFAATFFVLRSYSHEVTLLDRFYEFSDKSRMVGYVPETRYYTWMPAWNFAKKHDFMGIGPSFAPYVTTAPWRDIVADQASGDVLEWPHNITLLMLCTVGIAGLLCYLFLVCRAVRLRKIFVHLGPYPKNCYYAYFLGFIMFLFEGQKFDGFLRHPDTNFYFIFILIGLLFSCENMTDTARENGEERHAASA